MSHKVIYLTKRHILPISSWISFPWTIDKPNYLILTGFFMKLKFFFFSWCWQENYPNSTNIDVFLLHDFIISYCRFVSFLEFQNTHDSSQLLSEKDVEKNTNCMFEWHKLWRGINSINWIFDTQSMTFVKLLTSNY